jgi:outer membrane protein assembly factor BamB
MRGGLGGLAGLSLLGVCAPSIAAPPEATAYQITVDHAGVTTSGGALALQETPLWTIATFPSPSGISYPIIAGGSVYVTAGGTPDDVTLGTTLYAFDAHSGVSLWPNPVIVPSTMFQWSNLTYDAGKIFVLSSDGSLRYFDAATGAPGTWPSPVSVGQRSIERDLGDTAGAIATTTSAAAGTHEPHGGRGNRQSLTQLVHLVRYQLL